MQLKTILTQCQKFKSFVYDQVRFVDWNGEKHIEVDVLAHRNSKAICSCCERPAPLYDRLNKRRFEFIPLLGLPGIYGLPYAACRLHRMWRC
jgi:transposase